MNNIFQLFIPAIFIASLLMHVAKRNSGLIGLYAFQSLAVVAMLLFSFMENKSILSFIVVVFALGVKVIGVPLLFGNLVRKNHIAFSASTYLNTPLTFILIAGLVAMAHSLMFGSLIALSEEYRELLAICLAVILLSCFLIANRRGVLSQIIGILSLENGIVAFAILAGLEELPVLQLGILFELFVWVAVVTVFAWMMYRKFETLETTALKHLQEE
ncbi:MAG: hypothetical protein A3E07_03670 [Candidatus Wildermuthbacteria bacterium RIFCSPHIGHO2_12_FULL_45_9]|uniref:Hydrogenase n=1 Tax=Candidatus Wildermuthbacteria bacterium RIFCSPHIGHO2_02_FULL_45_25 TaxID=1802450 RepID=A0A1G2R1V1_9BACT|nr:MAG: hypothetical protein A3C04_03455 [Candidatus Wildermuthbacteria bacterium RIFCSPHIGHO2_02_FULL_45_25]OHA72420.1 MAG: hypothetical protein A3E07_03670 [Candidatus Wildermuthbacteria bacterium RIFCSPHIGHO2_12_FULL_45_9]